MSVVRVSAKELTALILDEDRLRSERSDRKLWKSRVSGIDEGGIQGFGGGPEPSRRDKDRPQRRRRGDGDDDDAEYRLAIEASKHEAEEEERKRRQKTAGNGEDDDDLAKAIKLSKEEEELRRRELEESNAQSLFDDTPVQQTQPQPTGFNQGYQQQPAVDWFGNPVDAQQPMTTGYLNNQYAQPTGYQAQPTGYQNGFSNGFQAQPTGFDPSQQFGQPQNNFLQQSQPLQAQQTAFNNNNPYGSNVGLYGQSQQESFPQPGSHNPWATNQQSLDALKPAPTGSNNPFASAINRPQSQPVRTGPPALSSLAEEQASTQFNNFSPGPNPIANFQVPSPAQNTQQTRNDNPQYSRLNALLATGEGQDTFGNVGDLRIPAQHTAPGTFVNSAGQGIDRLRANQTGNNPFFSQQFTGAPRQTGFAQGSPFGAQQPQRQQQHGGSLIDL
jgi:epsin